MKSLLKWVKRIGLGFITLIILLMILGFIFEKFSRKTADQIIPEGAFVQVDSHRLHYYKKGNGGPTVVFETAFDPAGHLQWYHIQQELPTSYTTISYDRAGILWSERGGNPKSGAKIAEELHLLLEKIKAPKPYILVGHSFGGTLIRFFVSKYPEDVAGVIFVDSQHADDKKYLSPELFRLVNKGLPSGLLKFANTFGLARIMFKNMFPSDKQYDYQNSIMPALLYKSAETVLEEQDQMSSIKKEAAKIKSFGSIPLVVLTAADDKRFDPVIKEEHLKTEIMNGWSIMQKDFLRLSTASKQISLPKSGHYINQDQPQVIVKTIDSMITDYNLPNNARISN